MRSYSCQATPPVAVAATLPTGSDHRRPAVEYGPSHGVDVEEAGNGLLGDGGLFQLVRADDAVQERTLQITFLEPGVEAYAYTFG